MKIRLRNPTPTQWAIIGGSALVLAGLGATVGVVGARRRRRELPGVTDAPEQPTDEPVGPVDPIEPGAPVPWTIRTSADPGYPWEGAVLHAENYPTPGMWVDLNDTTGAFDPSDGFDRMVVAALGSALAMAGSDPGIATAVGQDPRATLGRRLRRQLREGIVIVGGINDRLYGQENLNLAGGNDPNASGGDPQRPMSGQYVLNEEGRGLNWLPRHADIIDIIEHGEPLRRTTTIIGRKLPSPHGGNHQMVVWIPAVDLDAIASDDPQIRFLTWSDGSSTFDPPPQIMDLGIDMAGVNLPGVP